MEIMAENGTSKDPTEKRSFAGTPKKEIKKIK